MLSLICTATTEPSRLKTGFHANSQRCSQGSPSTARVHSSSMRTSAYSRPSGAKIGCHAFSNSPSHSEPFTHTAKVSGAVKTGAAIRSPSELTTNSWTSANRCRTSVRSQTGLRPICQSQPSRSIMLPLPSLKPRRRRIPSRSPRARCNPHAHTRRQVRTHRKVIHLMSCAMSGLTIDSAFCSVCTSSKNCKMQ